MLRISKCILYSASSNIQNMRQASTGKYSKSDRIKKLMKEYKSVFGKLVETNQQKKRRLKFEKKGKVPLLKPNKINTELSWVIENSGSNLKKIDLSVEPETKHKNVVYNVSESQQYSDQTKKTDANSSNQTQINLVNPDDSQRNRKKLSKKFSTTILKIKRPADQTVKNTFHSKSKQDQQKIGLKTTDPTDGSSKIVNIDPNHIEIASATEHSHIDQVTSGNSHNNKQMVSSNACNIENAVANHKVYSTVEKMSNIIIKNLPFFSIMGNKQESSLESTEVLSISAKDDPNTITFPSVTRILTQTMPLKSKLALEAWKERMIKKLGQEGFDMHQKALLEDGASLHSCIAQNLLRKEYEVPPRIEPVFDSVRCVLEDICHVKAIETHVAHTKLHYRGIIDCVAFYRGENYVIDWKKSERKKFDLKETYDAPLQIAAYIGAINVSNLYPFMIKRGLLVIAYTCGAPATVYELCDDTLQQYWTGWLRRLQKYYVEATNDNNKGALGNKTLM